MPSEKHDTGNRPDERPTPGSQNRPMTEEEKLDTSLEDTFPTSDPVPASHVDGPEVVHTDRPKADRGPAERKGLSPTYDDGVEVGEEDAPLDDAGNPLNDEAGAGRR
ncbi:hypothetical protein NDN16_16330 [Aureimonas altamirensis]|uniref:hypothetical protein n=1 Tax=Aureimonas altamirensis TaxID=370622 RepID=UPI00203761F0|nr:hypothetical protein [Aureimonas altamirensis]MCM2505239.1 hypothetical protein [Aureimonas altamirensis]